jgi:hypothetical protein
MKMAGQKSTVVDSPIGKVSIDKTGSPVAAVKMEPDKSYVGVPALLQSFIDQANPDAWSKIKEKIDYIYVNIDSLLSQLDRETHFTRKVKSEAKAGKKLLFKPNIVTPRNIDPVTHGEGIGNPACTEWPFVAALMRWFHDKLDISYYQMMLGEAASATSIMAGIFSHGYYGGRKITTESIIEGRSGGFYGGWGFYFVRKYLAETHQASHAENPMDGYDESITGSYLPPGQVADKLMVYDLNRLYDVAAKQRTVPVPEGVNYKEITLHKVIVGGDRDNPQDMKDYPGCILINVPRLKIHAIDLLTNAVKNLGIGLYPMEVASEDPKDRKWKYAFPYDLIPGMKTEIPHQVWFPSMDEKTGLPVRNSKGEYAVTKTGGISGTQADVVSAVLNQGIFMLHIVDGIQAVNVSHLGDGTGTKVAEGLALASLNPVALDLLCARYCFKTIPMAEAKKLKAEHGLTTDFLQKVPVPRSDGKNIVTEEGFDSPFFRYHFPEYFERRGLGECKYYVIGWDATKGVPLASLGGHLGRVEDKRFSELLTSTLYYSRLKILWDLQRTTLSYFEANDTLTGSSFHKQTMDAFDENRDGVIDYDEGGKKGGFHNFIRIGASGFHIAGMKPYGLLQGDFYASAQTLRNSRAQWNPHGHDFMDQLMLVFVAATAFNLSTMEIESPDFLFPNMTWGKGKWPSIQFASHMMTGMLIYGGRFPIKIGSRSLYGSAFQYADKTLNGAAYTGNRSLVSDRGAVNHYIEAVAQGAQPLNFVIYVPTKYGTMMGKPVPNVQETTEAAKVFTAHFDDGREVWE